MSTERPPDENRRPDELLLDQLTEQLDRTRRLLTGSPEAAAEAALARAGAEQEAEARITAELAFREPLAEPDRFPEAHRVVMGALEVLDREGSRNPRVPNLGPLTAVAEAAVELVAEYIVRSYAGSIAGRLRDLYTRREARSVPGTPERRMLAGARVEATRIASGLGGRNPVAPLLLIGGAAVPVLASLSQWVGAVDVTSAPVLWTGVAALFVLFFALSWVLLRGAAVARRRSRLIMQHPLAALWETIGHAGEPPKDDAATFAIVAIALTAIVWIVLPAAVAALLVWT